MRFPAKERSLLTALTVLSVVAAVAAAAVTAPPAPAAEKTIVVGDFSGSPPPGPVSENEAPPGWAHLTFPAKEPTAYALRPREDAEGGWCLGAVSDGSASALFRRVEVDLAETPLLAWEWRVEGTVPGGDATKKSGDDYAARVYVTFEYLPGEAGLLERARNTLAETLFGFSPPARALSYIWANHLEKGSAVPNAYTEKSMMVAVESGEGLAGRWVREERDVSADYRELFGGEPPEVTSVAVMTDTDDTGSRASACYDGIVFTGRSPSPSPPPSP